MPFFSQTVDEVAVQDAFAAEAALEWENIEPVGDVASYIAPYVSSDASDKGAFDIYFISDTPSPFGVFVGVHGHLSGSRVKYLWMRMGRRAEEEIPEDIKKISDALKRYPLGFQEFCALLGEHDGPCEASIDMALPPNGKWSSRVPPRTFPEIPGFNKYYERLGLADESGTEVDIYFSPKVGVSFEIETKLTLRLNPNVFESACEIAWTKLRPFVEAR